MRVYVCRMFHKSAKGIALIKPHPQPVLISPTSRTMRPQETRKRASPRLRLCDIIRPKKRPDRFDSIVSALLVAVGETNNGVLARRRYLAHCTTNWADVGAYFTVGLRLLPRSMKDVPLARRTRAWASTGSHNDGEDECFAVTTL